MSEILLRKLYITQKRSTQEIARAVGCSPSKVNYWLAKYEIPKRSISDAIYSKWNPKGDPFKRKEIQVNKASFLLGLGVGLYWGEGTKMSKNQVRIGNTDPYLIKSFIQFLIEIYAIDISRLRFGLQIFSDMDQRAEERFWHTFLKVSPKQFYKTINTRSGSIGTYREKSKHGVVTIYFNNKRLRDQLVGEIDKIRKSV